MRCQIGRQKGWKFPLSTALPGAQDATGSSLKECAALLTPSLEDTIEALDFLGIIKHGLPTLASPRAKVCRVEEFRGNRPDCVGVKDVP